MASKEYIERLQMTVEHLHGCSAVHVASAHVKEVWRGETVWEGEVEAFDLTGHPKARRCYGWSYGDPEEFITILELPPVDSPQAAVRGWCGVPGQEGQGVSTGLMRVLVAINLAMAGWLIVDQMLNGVTGVDFLWGVLLAVLFTAAYWGAIGSLVLAARAIRWLMKPN